MTRTEYRLFAALALSLSLHLLPLLPDFDFGQNFRLTVAPLNAELRPPPATPATPPLSLPEQPKPASEPPPKPSRPALSKPAEKTRPPAAKTWPQAVREHFKKLDNAGQFYPADAIARGLEGEVLILLVIQSDGSVGGARVERSSGHPILDAAALKAVRSLQSLPADAPLEIVLPVNFRLR
jgi:periplasmic protein TonB